MAHFHRRSRCPPRSFRGFFIFNRSRNFLIFRALPPFDYIVKVRFQREPRKFFVLKLTLKITFISLYFNCLYVLTLSENRLKTPLSSPLYNVSGVGLSFSSEKHLKGRNVGFYGLGMGVFCRGVACSHKTTRQAYRPRQRSASKNALPALPPLSIVGGRRALIKEKC